MTESTFEGTHDGPLNTPGGDVIPPTGKRVSVAYTDAWQIRSGKAIYDRVHFDELELLADADVLHLHVGDPGQATDFDESPEGHTLH